VRVFFDVDYTILGQDGSVRPGTRVLFEAIVADGHQIYVWSGFGERRADLRRTGLDDLISGYFRKPLSGFHLGHDAWGLPFRPDFVVDDHPGLMVYLPGFVVTAYVDRSTPDDGTMARLHKALLDSARGR
jgi:hypothetical protein